MSTLENPSPSQSQNLHAIEIQLKQWQQLFNPHDPSPFRQRDLDRDAAEYLLECAKEAKKKAELDLKIYLPQEQINPKLESLIQEAIQHYFSYEEELGLKKLKDLLAQGRLFFITGFLFLSLCLYGSHLILTKSSGVFFHILGEGLNIIGWVAMWKPLEIFLYDWRPLRRLCIDYRRLSLASIQVLPL
ncbi:MAG: hypothetical protein KDK66_05630 [Deltaproteobacteria bacterium]|nr:hypothetical protein [Deltaproteobacteria bacterium]